MKFLKLIGFENLIILAFAQFIIKYGFLDFQPDLMLALNEGSYTLLVLASVLIAAGGFLINNITSRGSERYGISESVAYYIYGGLTIGGLAIGYYLSNLIGRPSFLLVFGLTVATLYFYATSLKESLLLGNIVIAFIIALAVMVIGIFNLYPMVGVFNLSQLATIFDLLLDYSVFTLIIGLMITLVKDLKDTDVDYNEGLNTLPIAIGKKRTAKIVFAIGLVATALLLYYANAYLKELLWALGYGLLFILGPIIYFLINILTAKTTKEFAVLEIILKFTLFFTAISIAVITFNIKYNA